MGPVLQTCRSRRAAEIEDGGKGDMMSRLDRELNQLSDDEQAEDCSDENGENGRDGSENDDATESDGDG